MSSVHAVTPGPAALDVLGVDGDSARRDNRPRNVIFFALCACAIRLHPVSTTQNTLWESDDNVKKRGRQLWRTKILF